MKIIYIYPHSGRDIPSVPYGVLNVVAYLKQFGHEAEIWDLGTQKWTREQLLSKIRNANCDAFGISAIITRYEWVKWLCQALKSIHPEKKIIVGGSVADSIPHILLKKTGADIAVDGEGEITALELLERIKDGATDFADVDGIYYMRDGEMVKTKPREVIQDLDSLPYIDYSLVDMKTFFKYARTHTDYDQDMIIGKKNILGMFTSRGCPYRCTFCYRNFGNKVRVRSVENVVEEIRILVDKFNLNRIHFFDELFTNSQRRTLELCEAFQKNGFKFKWGMSTRIDHINPVLLKALKAAGCVNLYMGLESANDQSLKAMQKLYSREKELAGIKMVQDYGFHLRPTFIAGMPGDEREHIWDTVRLCQDYGLYGMLFYATPYPGTPLYEDAKKMKAIGETIEEEEEYVSQLGEARKFVVNVSKMTNEELISVKEAADIEIAKCYGVAFRRRFIKNLFFTTINHINRYFYDDTPRSILKKLFTGKVFRFIFDKGVAFTTNVVKNVTPPKPTL